MHGLILQTLQPVNFADGLARLREHDAVTLVGYVDHSIGAGRDTRVRPLDNLGLGGNGPFTPHPSRPAVVLVIRRVFPPYIGLTEERDGVLHLIGDTQGPAMASGCYAVGDSRFESILRALNLPTGPVSMHDRVESWDLYRAMSQD